MNRRTWILGLLAGLAAGLTGTNSRAGSPPSDPSAGSEAFFESKIRPLLASSCIKCHGEKKQSGSLRLDSREAMLAGGDNGPAIEPGDPENSLLVVAVHHTDDILKMPPNQPMSKPEIADLTAWVKAGAPWPSAAAAKPIAGEAHWAFLPLHPPTPPEDPSGWAKSPIDRFIAASQREHGVHPVARADRRALIRRTTFDLTGLPPEPARIEAFVNDKRPNAFAVLIDELLASPRYGERWGRYWLDLARYADTAGDNSDYPIPEAYLYRDYVIDAFNADIPYDRFIHEQIAGDILAQSGPPEDYARQVIATGFLAQSKRFGTRKLEDIHQIIEDTLHTTGQTVLGLTMRCARCHDHKFDPISQRDYYALYGFFAGTKYPFAGAEEDHKPSEFAPLVPPSTRAEYEAKFDEAVRQQTALLTEAETQGEATQRVRRLSFGAAEAAFLTVATGNKQPAESAQVELLKATRSREQILKQLRGNLDRLKAAGPLAMAPVAYAVRDGEPTDVMLQHGGDPRKLGDIVPRGVLTALEPDGKIDLPAQGSGRLTLARWLTEGAAGPLAARVMANRIWQHHFGKPIVPTPSDFGLRGTPPSHPELLEWLASEFVASGWSIKAMHRHIMLSETYQLAAEDDSASADADTGNTYYWRADRQPLDAEALRDTLLYLGGNLNLDRPGPHPFPPVESWRFSAHHQFHALYPSEHRSVFLMVQRLHPHPYLSLFNGPDTSASTASRDQSTVSLQALYLLNNPFVHDQAARFARQIEQATPGTPERITLAYERAFGHPPTPAEQERAQSFLTAYGQQLATEGATAEAQSHEAWTALARALFASNAFLYLD